MNIKIRKTVGLWLAVVAVLTLSLAAVAAPGWASPNGGHPPTQGTHPLNPVFQRGNAGQDDPMSVGFPAEPPANRIAGPPAWTGHQYQMNIQPCGWYQNAAFYGQPSMFAFGSVGWGFPNLGNDMEGVPGGPDIMSLYGNGTDQMASLWDGANQSLNPTLDPCAGSEMMWWFGQ